MCTCLSAIPLDESNLSDVVEKVVLIKSLYCPLGQALRLRADDLAAICEAHPHESEAKQALKDVLQLWLRQKYNVEKFGLPTWRMLVEAVDKKYGGNNHDLAKEIASNHPAGMH